GFISLIGISNSLTFKEILDPRVRSSLSERKKDEGNNNNGSSSTYDYLTSALQVEYRAQLVARQVGVQSICLSRRGLIKFDSYLILAKEILFRPSPLRRYRFCRVYHD
ncbi:MAG: hypothetical protein WBE34_15015, partial [Candidatus Nitrosopolaris sp.]